MKNIHIYVLCAYILCAVLTFGHAFSEMEKNHISPKGSKIHITSNTAGALMCGLAFPLYWSVQAFK